MNTFLLLIIIYLSFILDIVSFRLISSNNYRNHDQYQLKMGQSTSSSSSTTSSSSLSSLQKDIEDTAIKAALLAGDCIRKGRGSINLNTTDIESKIGSRDIVTKVDKESQDIIKSTILAKFPNHKFLGEEDIEPGIEASKEAIKRFEKEEHLWIVDPIDGTTNFAHGLPICGVIIAYASRGQVIHGCIHDPFFNETFTATKDNGAFLNGQQIKCCNTDELKSSVVCTGSPPNFKSLEACLRAQNILSSQVRTMRMLGSAATMLSWIAARGRVTAYFEADLNVWDLAAGVLIIQEAGGRVTDVWGNDYTLGTRNLVASNGKIHDKLLAVLQQAEMWIKD
jgi:myo-inositol-1(or 4)-monophosphatase